MTRTVLARELKYVLLSIDSVSKNESSWNYLRGLANYHPELKEEIILKYVQYIQNQQFFLLRAYFGIFQFDMHSLSF